MKRNRLTLVVPEERALAPSDGMTDAPPVLNVEDPGAPRLRLVQADEGSFPHDAA
jgi:hypothetical protein